MHRKYAKKDVRCTYDSSALEKAIQAVKQGLSLAAAEDKFKVLKSTLGKHYKHNAVTE